MNLKYFTILLLYCIIENMKRICLTIEYDGSNYKGWQKQPNEKTIQGEIEDAIFQSLGERVEVFGSGRTDAGVHAIGQTAHFDMSLPVPVSKLAYILNNALPDNIVIKSVREVNEDFHARFSIKKKCYLYKIYNSQEKNAFLSNRVGYIRNSIDIQKMREGAKLLIGKHDFKGYCSANTATQNFEREIFDIKINREEDFIFVEVCGNGFLYNMVRIIVGSLVDYALDRITLQDLKIALEKGDRSRAGQTMPPQGLYLKETFY